MDSHKNKGVRSVVDPNRSHLLNLPTTPKRVSREVSPGQKVSYKMSVHHNPLDTKGGNDTFRDREADPGSHERSNLGPDGLGLIDYTAAHGRVEDIFKGGRSAQMGLLAPRVGAAVIGTLVDRDKYDQVHTLLQSPHFDNSHLSGVSASTWRKLIKEGPLDLLGKLHGFKKDIYHGELSVLSNTLLRRGENSLKYLLPEAGSILKDERVVDFPNQQLFNAGGTTLPSNISPHNKAGVNVLDAAGSKWVYTEPRPSNWINNFLEQFNGGSIRVALPGFPSKQDSRQNVFNISPQGLSNSYLRIGRDDILRVLGGFIADLRKIPGGEMTDDHLDKMPHTSFMFPNISQTLSPDESGVRTQLVSFSNGLQHSDIGKAMYSAHGGSVGVSELDIHTDNVYHWNGSRKTAKPYGPATEESLFTTSFPHPLIKYNALKYLGLWPDALPRLVPQVVASLPLKVEKRSYR